MTKVKEQSTRNQNKGISELSCPITYVMNKIGGNWKATILYYLMSGPKRYSELKKLIPAITEKMLAQHLKQLKEDNLVFKKEEQLKPPITIYSLTPAADELRPILMAMADWAIKDNKRVQDLMTEPIEK
ncbi:MULTISPECIES: winged helix-turn-helix transcriptional regulator [Niastella]|uniref:Helix-turn-helix transcriptional regulator n=1 Tax=Niastella soli TaxID=2821487 RepID=A0ABS3YWU2_9BACT|nr:helix-turn-helix domain-containing protein [Niastella soli]MBO9202396.1 helix-turn-helix transcriptional regulator [Niastella soli]